MRGQGSFATTEKVKAPSFEEERKGDRGKIFFVFVIYICVYIYAVYILKFYFLGSKTRYAQFNQQQLKSLSGPWNGPDYIQHSRRSGSLSQFYAGRGCAREAMGALLPLGLVPAHPAGEEETPGSSGLQAGSGA